MCKEYIYAVIYLKRIAFEKIEENFVKKILFTKIKNSSLKK